MDQKNRKKKNNKANKDQRTKTLKDEARIKVNVEIINLYNHNKGNNNNYY